MGAVKERMCFGAYENEGDCETCPIALVCIDMTLENDGYFDRLAEREEEEWVNSTLDPWNRF